MESWSYASEEKSYLLSDEMDFSLEAFMRGRKALVDWDNKASCNFEKDEFSSDGEVVKSMEVLDLGFSDLFRTGNQPLNTSNFELDRNSSKRVNSPTHVIALDSSLVEEESELKHSGSLVESKIHDSSLIDLKLGRLADCKEASSDKIAKRVRTSSSPTQTPVCQVYGCNMDLSSSKEYHKRHKVCDVHSKTAKVIVNGIEQRFCQQCSRFHLLAEFDEGKRSCRRRLAGHNERRRKPQFDYMSCKPHKMLQSYQGTKYLGPLFQKRPQLAFEDMFRSGIFTPGKYEQTRQSGHIKFEAESIYCPQLAPVIHGQELSRASNTSCALSLLSVQSQNLSCLSAENPVSSSLIFPGIHTHSSDDRVSEIPLGLNSLDKYAQNESSSHGMNSMEAVKNGSIMLSDAGHAAHLQVHNICQPSDLSREHGTTLDLFQLSSHLRRVEHQRNSFFQ